MDLVKANEKTARPKSVVEVLDMGTVDRLVEPASAALRNVVEAAGKRALEKPRIDDQKIVDPLNQDTLDRADG